MSWIIANFIEKSFKKAKNTCFHGLCILLKEIGNKHNIKK